MKEITQNIVFLLQGKKLFPSLLFLLFLHVNVIYKFFMVGRIIFSGF